MNNELNVRPLSGGDTMLLLAIFGKANVADSLKVLVNKQQGYEQDKDLTQDELDLLMQKQGAEFMADVLNLVFSNIHKAETEVNTLMARLTDLTVQEVKELDFATYNNIILKIFKDKQLTDFIKQLFLSMK